MPVYNLFASDRMHWWFEKYKTHLRWWPRRISLVIGSSIEPHNCHCTEPEDNPNACIPWNAHLVEGLSVVHTNDGSDHLGDDDHVAQVRLDDGRLLVDRSLLLGLAQLLDQSERLALQSTLETPARAAVHQLNQLVTAR